jgi:hypothetical protein
MPADVRTSLLHRMLVVRELLQSFRAAGPPSRCHLPAIVGRHAEACLVGITAALGPLDLLVPDGSSPSCRPPPTMSLVGAAPLRVRLSDPATCGELQELSALFIPRRPSGQPEPQGATEATVDGWDVEAVLTAARKAARLARGEHGPQLLRLAKGGPGALGDPVAVLSGRLLRDRQLDSNALDAIGRDARRVAAALSAAFPGVTGDPVPCPLSAGSQQFLLDSAAYAARPVLVARTAPAAKRADRRPPPGRPPR